MFVIRKYCIPLIMMLLCVACNLTPKLETNNGIDATVEMRRYDIPEIRYITTGDFSAQQHLFVDYPRETRTLIEDILRLGRVDDPEINSKFLNLYQDSRFQFIISDVDLQYADMSDINKQLSEAFERLHKLVPDVEVPQVYSQVGALNQSVTVADGMICVSLDKYLGTDYPIYSQFYTEQQRQFMTRDYIVPDCISFYLMSVFPIVEDMHPSRYDKDIYIAKVQWLTNKVTRRTIFEGIYIDKVDNYMKKNSKTTVRELFEGSITI